MKISKIFLNIDKEEQWLNEMSRQGYRLIGKHWFEYEFMENTSGVVYRYYIDQRGFRNDNQDFVDFLSEINIQLVAKQFGYYYFEADHDCSVAEIYTDSKSKQNFYWRCILTLAVIAVLNISIINGANGPYLFNISIPLVVNTGILIAVTIACLGYIRCIFQLWWWKGNSRNYK